MKNLEVSDAFNQLGLPISASREQIEEKFRVLCLTTHPDKGGSSEAFHDLQQARETAISHIDRNVQLVPISVVKDIISSMGIVPSERKEAVKTELNRITRLRLTRYRRLQRNLLILASLSGLVSFLYSKFSPFPNSAYPSTLISLMFLAVAASLILLREMTRSSIVAYEEAVADFDDVFADKQNFYQIMGALLGNNVRGEFSSGNLEAMAEKEMRKRESQYPLPLLLIMLGSRSYHMRSILLRGEVDFRHLARILGPLDLTRYLVRKGLEIGALTERKDTAGVLPLIVYRLS
ncbi:MAG: DnaJ domain [Thermoplasmata archaeon]|nr:DnaJ domain [Thermoplasmata archaeon]